MIKSALSRQSKATAILFFRRAQYSVRIEGFSKYYNMHGHRYVHAFWPIEDGRSIHTPYDRINK